MIGCIRQVLFLDVNGYLGESSKRELAYAKAHGKVIRYLSQEKTSGS